MRIRQIKPGWWLDKDLRRGLSADAREFYIGLWMLADDAGWIDWDLEHIAAELYPYGVVTGGLFTPDPIEAREAAVATWARQLEALSPDDPHLVLYPCGHAQIPKLTNHQRVGGRPVYTVQVAHARGCARMRADAHNGRVGNGRERVGNGSAAPSPEGEAGAGLKGRLGSYEDIIASGKTQ